MEDSKLSIKEMFSNIRFMAAYLFRMNKKLYFVRLPIMLLQTVSSLLGIFFLGQVLNLVTGSRDLQDIVYCALFWAIAQGLVLVLINMLNMYDSRESERTRLNVQLDLAKETADMPLSEVERPYMKDLIALAQSSDSLGEFVRQFSDLARSAIQAVTYFSMVFLIQPWILLLIMLNILGQLLLQKFRLAYDDKWRVEEMPEFRKKWYLNELLYDVKYGKENRVNHLVEWIHLKKLVQFKKHIAPLLQKCMTDSFRIGLLSGIIDTISNVILYLLLVYKVIFHKLRIGDFSIYLASAEKLMRALRGIMYSFSDLLESAVFVKEFRYCMEFNRKEKAELERKQDFGKVKPYIEFKDVSFQYPNTEHEVLSHISFAIHPGETAALVGLNGSGKSTLVKLLCRFYEPTGGEILVGGINIKEIPREDYVAMLGVVFQDYKLFSFTVAENVTMGVDKGSGSCEACIGKSGLGDKLQGLPDHGDTYITKQFDERGIEFSGGESQKLAIARVIYKDAPIVVLDEPTAAMDPVMEYEIFCQFDQLVRGKTAIYISHRLSTTRIANKIMVLQDGRICETGSHEQLMAMEGGIYKEMFTLQAGYYKEA